MPAKKSNTETRTKDLTVQKLNLRNLAIGCGILAVCLIVTFFVVVKITTIAGNELGVHETWAEGVINEVVTPGTKIFFPGFTHKIYPYDMSSQIYVMNDKPMHLESKVTGGREKDAYIVQSTDGQDLIISLNVRWRLDPKKLIDLHKHFRTNFDEKILRPTLLLVAKNKATIKKATDAYSGPGLVQLQSDIEQELTKPDSEIRSQGIIVENFVIEQICLDPNYIDEIKRRQIAVQRELRNKQEELAAVAEASKAKAEAQADLNRQVVAAERDKQIGVLKAEGENRREVIAAEAQKQKTILAAEGEKTSGEMRAAAILAIGKATAEAKKLELIAYTGEGADLFAKIKIAESMASGMQNIHGYLPRDMTVNVLTSNFLDSVNQMLSDKKPSLSLSPPIPDKGTK